ncbi:50S ribosomal protein L6 [Parcubacteria bacterium DG_72]|nr:MAG: 50S ribosomal protein L6 [Parcubacteria bacterium DG_72]
MSRIGKKPIQIPDDVEINIAEGEVNVKGPKGELSTKIPPEVLVRKEGENIIVSVERDTKKTKALWGLTRTLIYNMVEGVVKGHEKKLEIQGVGYRANLEGENLVLLVGFSHPVKIKKPENINFTVEKNIITISGIDKELVGQTAAKIRKVRKPEPYKGKGIRYIGEIVKRKVGKKAVGVE